MRQFYFFVLFMLLSIYSFGQIQIGIKSGYNYFFIIDKELEPTTYSIDNNSWVVAISLRERTPGMFNMGFEIEYISHNFSVDSRSFGHYNSDHAQYSYSIGYLNLYILPQFVFGKHLKWFVYVGPYVGQLTNSKINGTLDSWYGATNKSITREGKAAEDFVRTDFGFATGAGIDIPIFKRLNFLIEIGSSIGFRNLAKAWSTDFFNFLNLKAEVGFTYNIGNQRLFKEIPAKKKHGKL